MDHDGHFLGDEEVTEQITGVWSTYQPLPESWTTNTIINTPYHNPFDDADCKKNEASSAEDFNYQTAATFLFDDGKQKTEELDDTTFINLANQQCFDGFNLDESDYSQSPSSILTSLSPMSSEGGFDNSYSILSSSSCSSVDDYLFPNSTQPNDFDMRNLANVTINFEMKIQCKKESVITAGTEAKDARKNSQLTIGMNNSHNKLRNLPPSQKYPLLFLGHTMKKGALLANEYWITVQPVDEYGQTISSEVLLGATLQFKINKSYDICNQCSNGLQHEISNLNFLPNIATQLKDRFIWIKSNKNGSEIYLEDSTDKIIQVPFFLESSYRLFFPCACEHQTNKLKSRKRVIHVEVQLSNNDEEISTSGLDISISSTPARSFLRYFKLPHKSLCQFLEDKTIDLDSYSGIISSEKTNTMETNKRKANKSQNEKKNVPTKKAKIQETTTAQMGYSKRFCEVLDIAATLDTSHQSIVKNCFQFACNGKLSHAKELIASLFGVAT